MSPISTVDNDDMESTINNNHKLKHGISRLLKILNISLNALRIEPHLGEVHNCMGQIYCISITGTNQNNENVKLNLMGKLKPDPTFALEKELNWKYRREVYIYENVLTTFCKLQKDKKMNERFVAYPKHYLSVDEDFIMLANMANLGFKSYKKYDTLNYNHASLILKELGKLHALSFVLRKENIKLFETFHKNTNRFKYDKVHQEEFEPICAYWFTEALKLLDGNKLAYTKYIKLKNRFFDLCFNFEMTSRDRKYAVFGHCDCWLPNILFKSKDGASDDHPSEVCLLDWQAATRSSPAVDVSQVLYCCCDHNLRKHHYKNLIKVYYNSFSSFLSQFGLDSKTLFPYQVFQQHLKKYSVIGLCTAIVTTTITAIETHPDVHNKSETYTHLNTFKKCKMNNNVHQRIKDVMLDHLRYGYDV